VLAWAVRKVSVIEAQETPPPGFTQAASYVVMNVRSQAIAVSNASPR